MSIIHVSNLQTSVIGSKILGTQDVIDIGSLLYHRFISLFIYA